MKKQHSKPWKVYRNDPCSCGSGRKFKHCCLPRRERRPRVQTHKMREGRAE